jgi:two-component system, NarL family, nitrate/nitrite sensor histidine kinase NarX
MLGGIDRSLLWRMGLGLSLIAAAALFGIIASVLISEQVRGAATAINHAGTLRYSTYDATTAVLRPQVVDQEGHRRELERALDRFERHYAGDPLYRMVPEDPAHPARRAYHEVGSIWEAAVRPMLLSGLGRAPDAGFYDELRGVADDFVQRVDEMVFLLEQRTEARMQLLRIVQAVGLALTLLVILSTVWFLRRDVVRPLRELLAGAQAVRRGDFRRRIGHTGEDELGQLGSAFNLMARDLSRSYDELERRVEQKTRALEYSNRALELMYRSLSHLHDGTLSRANYTETLREMEKLLGLGRGSLCLLESDGRKGFRLADSGRDPGSDGPLCEQRSCAGCVGIAPDGGYRRGVADADSGRLLSIPIHDGAEIHALLRMELPDGVTPEPWQLQLVEAIAHHLGIAIASQRRAIQSRRLALLEERAAIARELHDSLAQGLSYLKIQVTRVQVACRHIDHAPELDAALTDLREGLNGAYRQLRELLTTFRIGIDAEGLNSALEETVAGITARGAPYVELENRLADGELGINEEVHVLHIIREALCNVLHHAEATRTRVTLDWTPDRRVRVAIVDNGVGIGEKPRKADHYGLSIMLERAAQLKGELDVGRAPEGGTHVRLVFRPVGLTHPDAGPDPACAVTDTEQEAV